jgi:hypothetical protein
VVVNETARCDTCRAKQDAAVGCWIGKHPQGGAMPTAAAAPEAKIPAAPVRVLQPRFAQLAPAQRRYDFFINHAQSSGQDQAGKLRMLLEQAGATVWYDMGAVDLTARGMEDAVHGTSGLLILLLT